MSCARPLARTARGRRNESDLDCTHLDRRMMRRGRHPWFDTWQGAIARNPVNDDVHCARALSVSAGGDCQSRASGAALRAAAETTIARFDGVIVSVDGAVSLLSSLVRYRCECPALWLMVAIAFSIAGKWLRGRETVSPTCALARCCRQRARGATRRLSLCSCDTPAHDLIELIDLRNVHLFLDTRGLRRFRAGRGSKDRAAAPAIPAAELGDQVELVHLVGRAPHSIR